jgi:hypothetical protein
MMGVGRACVGLRCAFMASHCQESGSQWQASQEGDGCDESENEHLVAVCRGDGTDVGVPDGPVCHADLSAVRGGENMGQVLDGTFAFEVPGDVSPSVLLQRWLAFGSQVSVEGELTALGHALEAVNYELQARACDHWALWWVQTGQIAGMEQARDWFRSLLCNLRQASWHWGKAASWLKEFGDPAKAALYASLYAHVLEQQQRLSRLVEQRWAWMQRCCQEWGSCFRLTSAARNKRRFLVQKSGGWYQVLDEWDR